MTLHKTAFRSAHTNKTMSDPGSAEAFKFLQGARLVLFTFKGAVKPHGVFSSTK
jgi:hypothetical protein